MAFEDVASGIFSLTWGDDSLYRAIQEGNERVHNQIMSVMEYQAPNVEAHARNTAPWTDQTGNARQGLRAQAFDEGDNMGIILYHSVSYGIWLELAHDQRFAVIEPTIEVMGPQVMQSLQNILGKI